MRRCALGVICLSVLAAACTSPSDAAPAPKTREITPASTAVQAPSTTVTPGVTVPTTTSAVELPEFEIDFEQLSQRVDAGFLTVPLDYADPEGATIDLYVARHSAKADQRVGIILVNNGGPGSPASSMALDATSWFLPDITDRFDVIAWDPRGTGVSGGAVDCIDDDEYDRFFAAVDITPDDNVERQQMVSIAEEFAARCIDRVGPALQYIGTNNSARDMDAIRRALGEDQASYFGFSYGSELGATWATMFPTTVRAAVLDGAADPNADAFEHTRQQWTGFEGALNTFLADCSDNSSCAFYNNGDAESAFDSLLAELDENPLPSSSGRAEVNLGVAVTGVVRAMYSDQFWPALERSLEDAAAGDGAGLLALQDAYYQRRPDGSYSNLIESFQAISCADDPDRPTVAEADQQAEELLDVAPRLFPYTTGSYSCTFFPPSLDPRLEVTGIGAGPIVVIGTTGDPSTPLESSRNMAAALEDGRLVVVEANQHTGYRVNSCINNLVGEYLVQLTAPESETICG